MYLKDCLMQYMSSHFSTDKDVKTAVEEFFKNIPGRILEYDIDPAKNSKQGIKKDNSIYKFGVTLEKNLAFLEFYEDRSQGRPSMAIYLDRNTPSVLIKGFKIEKQYILSFTLENGVIKKVSKLS